MTQPEASQVLDRQNTEIGIQPENSFINKSVSSEGQHLYPMKQIDLIFNYNPLLKEV